VKFHSLFLETYRVHKVFGTHRPIRRTCSNTECLRRRSNGGGSLTIIRSTRNMRGNSDVKKSRILTKLWARMRHNGLNAVHV